MPDPVVENIHLTVIHEIEDGIRARYQTELLLQHIGINLKQDSMWHECDELLLDLVRELLIARCGPSMKLVLETYVEIFKRVA